MKKAEVRIGCSRGSMEDYKITSYEGLVGADITATDGCENLIEISVRAGDTGYRIALNGKTIAES